MCLAGSAQLTSAPTLLLLRRSVDIGAAVEDKLLSIIGISLLLSISQFVRSDRCTRRVSRVQSLISGAVSHVRQIVMNFLLVKRNIVQHRRLFMLAEFVYTLLNLFNGALVALLRLIVSILFFGATTPLPHNLAVCGSPSSLPLLFHGRRCHVHAL